MQQSRAMDVNTAVTLAVAIAPWVGIYWQARQVRLSEKDLGNRVAELENINRAILAEKTERERQIGERSEAHRSLQVESYLSEGSQRASEIEIQIINDLAYYNLLVTFYLFNRDAIDKKEPKVAIQVSNFCVAHMNCIGARGTHKMLRSDPNLDIEANVAASIDSQERYVKTLESAFETGRELGRSLNEHGFLTYSDGSSFDSHIVQVSKVWRGTDDVVKKLRELLLE